MFSQVTGASAVNGKDAGPTMQSIWNSYESLMQSPDFSKVEAMGEGFDVDFGLVEQLYTSPAADEREDSVVALAHCTCYRHEQVRAALTSIFDKLELESRLRTVRSVFIKLGLIQAVEWQRHVTTTPLFLEVLIDLLKHLCPGAEIMVGDASGHERDFEFLLRTCGISNVLRRHRDVRFFDLNVADTICVDVPQPLTLPQLAVPEVLVNADFVISLAKLKTHKWTGVSLSLKNLFGILPGSIYGYPKNRLHWASYPRVIADIASAVRPNLALIDGVCGVEGNGPLNGEVRNARIIVAGYDPVATDALATQLMGISPHMVPQFWFAANKRIGTLGSPVLEPNLRSIARPFAVPPNWLWLERSAFLPPEEQLRIIRSLLIAVEDRIPYRPSTVEIPRRRPRK